MVKTLPAVQETCVWSLGREDLLEKERATHSSILAWRIPWTEEPGGPNPWGCKESDWTEWLTHKTQRKGACLLWGWSALFNIYRLKCWSNVNSTITEIAGVDFEQIYEYRSLAKLTHKIYHHKGLLVQVKEWGFDPSGFWRVNCFIPVFLGSTPKMYLLPEILMASFYRDTRLI